MKFLKLLAAFTALALLSGCAKKSEAPSENNARIVDDYNNTYENGMLRTDDMFRLSFFDFDTFQSALLCSKPNCTHKNADDCSAFGMRNHPILYNDKLYFFQTDTDFDGDEPIDITTVWKADTDGTNRTKVCTIEGLALHVYTSMLLIDNMLYFPMSKMPWDMDIGATTGNDECWWCSYDLSTNTFTRIECLREEWAGNAWIYGLYDGKVIFQFTYSDRKMVTIEDVEKYCMTDYKTYDLESGEIAELTLPKPLVVKDGYYICEKDGGVAVLNEKGDEISLPDFPTKGTLTVADGKLFNFFEKKCADLTSGKMYEVNFSEEFSFVVAFVDGKFIFEDIDNATQAHNYYKIDKKDLIGDAL